MLLNAREYQTDLFLVQIVRIEQLSNKARKLLLDVGQNQITYNMHAMAIALICRDLEELISHLPHHVKTDLRSWRHISGIPLMSKDLLLSHY